MLFALQPALLMQPRLAASKETYRVVSRGFGPVGKILYRRPTIGWAVTAQNGARVTSATLTINSIPIAAEYDQGRGEVMYTPPDCLKPGTYDVEVILRVNDAVTFRKKWTTEVPMDAKESLPAPKNDQLAVFDAVNRLRDGMNLPRYTLDRGLCAAAEAHADYLKLNDTLGHQQTPGRPGFLGEYPWDRTRAFGFTGATWEAAGYEAADPKNAVDAIFDAPYHRIPFMHPSPARVGIGVSPRGTVVDGEAAVGEGVVASPGSGEKGARRSWTCSERPDPLRRFANLPPIVGYPIVFAAFGGVNKLEVASARLTLGGKPVATVLDTPADDEHLTNAAILIPTAPLAPKTTYTVEFVASMDGKDVGRRWSFTTGG